MNIEKEMSERKPAGEGNNLKTLVFLPQDKTGCGYYRCALPSIAMCRKGIPAHLLTSDRMHLYNIADNIVLQRPYDSNVLAFIEGAREHGLKIFYELDDNVFNIPDYNQSFEFWTEFRQQIVMEIMNQCDALITTTPYFADFLKQYNDDVRIVPNAIFDDIPFSLLPSYLSLSEDIIIGWIGSSFHRKDLTIFNELIPAIMNKYKNVKFLTMGEPPPRQLRVFGERLIHMPFVESIFYHEVLSRFSIQIGIAPLVDNEFNRCKSPVKAIEYLYTKTFPILSDLPPYSDFLKDQEFGFLIPTSPDKPGSLDDWMDAIDWCIQNPEKREELAEKGHEYVLDNFNVECDPMFEIYKSAYEINEVEYV